MSLELLFLPPANEVWGKIIFLHLCVILFTVGGGGSLCPSMHHRSHEKRGSLSRGSLSMGVSRRSLSMGVSVKGVFVQGASVCGVSVKGISIQGGGICPGEGLCLDPQTETPHIVTSGWHASYWNAFLC